MAACIDALRMFTCSAQVAALEKLSSTTNWLIDARVEQTRFEGGAAKGCEALMSSMMSTWKAIEVQESELGTESAEMLSWTNGWIASFLTSPLMSKEGELSTCLRRGVQSLITPALDDVKKQLCLCLRPGTGKLAHDKLTCFDLEKMKSWSVDEGQLVHIASWADGSGDTTLSLQMSVLQCCVSLMKTIAVLQLETNKGHESGEYVLQQNQVMPYEKMLN